MKTKLNLGIIVIILFTIINSNTKIKHFCTVDNRDIKIKYPKINNKSNIIKRNLDPNDNNNNENFKPIQIHVDKTYLEYQNSINSNINSLYSIIIKGLDKCVYTLNKLLKVKPLQNKINYITDEDLNNWNFNSNFINPKIKEGGEGISTDLLILPKFSIDETISFDYIEGYPVYFDEQSNRPIIGILNINSLISLDLENIDYLLQSILLHELTHILGFLISLFKFYPGGESNTIEYKEEKRTNVMKGYIITPKVIEFSKKYFNCDSIGGIELERSSSNTIADSHWEARLLLGEYMISEIYTPEQVISEFTLALLEDSGWYKANYYTGGLMRFGKNQGCTFIEKDCYSFKVDELGNEFFQFLDSYQPSCSSGRQSRTYFTIRNSESFILSNYNRNTKFIGRKSADYCWVNDLSENEEEKMLYVGNCQRGGGYYGEEVYFKGRTVHPSSSFPEELGEIYSKNSFCALSSVYPIGKNEEEKNNNYGIYDNIIHSLCYPMFCTNSSLTIQIYDHFIVCPREGGKVAVEGDYTGYLFCPDYNLICTGTKMCNDMFDCVEKESLLKENVYEYDYSGKTHQSFRKIKKLDIVIDYEKENDGVCPKFCSRCKLNKKCYKCEENKILIGKHKNDLEPITCNDTLDITDKHYLDTEENVYYECPKGCESCQDENNCITCSEGYIKNILSQCEEIIENCDVYNNDFTQCIKCKNNSYIIGDNHKNCNKEINIENYYTEDGISYLPCNTEIENCNKCSNKSHCLKCDENYYFKGNDRKKCYEESEIEKDKYFLEDNGTSYYLCTEVINNCDKCVNKNKCEKCENGYVIVEDSNNRDSCKKDLNEELYYHENDEDNEDRIIYHLCSDAIEHCENCINKEKCIKCEDNYYNLNYRCYKESEIEKEKDKYYTEDNGITYFPCDTHIINCDKCSNKTNCIKCKDNNYFIGEDRTKCYKDEENEINKEEYYTEDNGISYYKCDEVIKNCNKCLNKSYCIKCDNEYYIIGEEKDKCYNKNDIDDKKYFIYKDNVSLMLCNSTLENCDECQDKSNCIKCKDNYIFINNDRTKCINESEIQKEQYFTEDNGKTYYSCDTEIPNCNKCINRTNCIKCNDNYFLIDKDTAKCYKENENEINKDEYFTEDNGASFIKCEDVMDNCNKCFNRSQCIKCKEDYYLIGEEKDKCIEKSHIEDKKYFIDDNNTTIYFCNSSILNCNECSNKTFCEKCKDGYFFVGQDKTKCVNESELKKENKYILDKNTNIYYPCLNEISNCEKCLNKSYCIKCKENYFFIKDDRSKCYHEIEKENYFTEDNGTSYYDCNTSISQCEKCLNKSFCIKCHDNFYLLDKNHERCFSNISLNDYYTEDGGVSYILCKDKINNCEECLSSVYCTKCEENYFFINNNHSTCVKINEKEEKKYFFDEDKKTYYTCNSSISQCDECSGKNKCIKCNENYYFIGEDRTKCNNDLNINKYYTEDNGISYYPCNSSIENCNECSNKKNCIKCNDGYFLIGENKAKCYNEIKNIDNYYTDDNGTSFKLCNSSINHCTKCENKFHCNECDNNYILVKNNNYSKCYKESEIEKEKDKYYTEDNGITYFPCDTHIINCDKCSNKTNCIKCKDNNYFIGEDRTKCYKDEENEINKEEYYTEDNGISYYKCDEVIKNCNKCLNKSYCIKCDNEYYIIGEEKDKCYNKNDIDDKKYFTDEDNNTFIPCNKSMEFCDECQDKSNCTKCKDNYFLVNNDKNPCRNKIDDKKYYSVDGGKTYYSCENEIFNCEECSNKNICTKCKNNYYLSNDSSTCITSSEISEICTIITNEIPDTYTFNLSLIEHYINSYSLNIGTNNNNYIVNHLINNYYNYSILIFKSSICTYSLIKKGYYYINTEKMMNQLLANENSNINDYIYCFITYNEKSNLFLFNQNDKNLLDIYGECPECLDIMFDINTNFTSTIRKKLGDLILKKIILNDIDVFDINEKIFIDICSNFTITGIDMPINLRIENIYLGLETEEIICTDHSCIFNNKSLSNFTGVCQCKINSDSLDYLLNNNYINTNYESLINSSKVKDSLNIFTCVNEGFNKNSFKNAGFNIFLIMILIQIIFLVFYIIFKNNIVQLNLASNPPRLIIHQNSIPENIKENESNNSNNSDITNQVEQNNQSKDLNDSDYDEEIYVEEENNDKKKRNKKKEELIMSEDNLEKKLKSEESKKHNNYLFKREKFNEGNNKVESSQSSLRTLSKKNKENNEDNKNEDNYDNDENKRKITLIKSTEQNLITDENKMSISQMKTMEDFMSKPQKKRSIKNISLTNKLALNKKHFHNIHNYSNLTNGINNKIAQKQNDKNKLTLTSNDVDNPVRVRDIILKNRFKKKDSIDSNKKLICEDSELDKNKIKIRPKSSNKTNKNTFKKNKSRESLYSYKNTKNYNISKISDNSHKIESPNEKTKKTVKIILNNEKIKKNILNSLIDYLPLEEVKNKDFRSLFRLYWNILSLRHDIINFFDFIKIFHITESYTPFQIKIIKFIFMLMVNMSINALILTQDYFKKKFYYFNNKYNILYIELENGIAKKEKIKYAMNNCFPRVLITFIICLIIQGVIEYALFGERKKMYKLFLLKGLNEINKNSKAIISNLRIKYYIYMVINFILVIIFYIYVTNFSAVYISGVFDYVGAGIWTFILLQIFPFFSSLVLSILRYYGLKKSNNTIYRISQILSY